MQSPISAPTRTGVRSLRSSTAISSRGRNPTIVYTAYELWSLAASDTACRTRGQHHQKVVHAKVAWRLRHRDTMPTVMRNDQPCQIRVSHPCCFGNSGAAWPVLRDGTRHRMSDNGATTRRDSGWSREQSAYTPLVRGVENDVLPERHIEIARLPYTTEE